MPVERQRLVDRVWAFFKRTGSQVLRNFLVEHYLPVVQTHAQRICAKLPPSVRVDELVSAGSLGLMDAIDQFEPSREVKFETFCTRRVCGAILDELRSMDLLSRLVRQRARKLSRVSDQLMAELGRRPSDEEIASRLDLSMSRFHKQFGGSARPVLMHSLSASRDADDREVGEIQMIADVRAADPLDEAQRRTLRDLVTRGMSRPERLIVLLYYYEGLNMREVGQALDLSESRVSQMHKTIVGRLQSKLAGRAADFTATEAA